MEITREVVTDLLPAYLSGEASADTRNLVEGFLDGDPEFARRVEEKWRRNLEALEVLPPALPPDTEKTAFEQTKRLLQRRSYAFALALAFTLFPLSFSFEAGRGVTWMLLRDVPSMALVFWMLALGGWIAYFLLKRRLKPTEL